MNEKAMSADGYIIDQSLIKELMYGIYPASVNGCGWIAAYNILHFSGHDVTPEDVFSGFLGILPFKGLMGTPLKTMREYFDVRNIKYSFHSSKKDIIAADALSGILRYAEGLEPHYAAFIKCGDAYRFFNAVEGDPSYIMPLEKFFKKHVMIPGVRAMLFF